MRGRKRYDTIASTLIVLLIPFLIVSFFLNAVSFDYNFYLDEFEKNNVYDSFPKDVIESESFKLRNYLKEPRITTLDSDFFNEKEKAHLVDVKNLLRLNKILLIAFASLVIFSIIWFIVQEELRRNFFATRIAGLLSLVLYLFIGVILYVAFDSAFLAFHETAFNNNLWQLNPNVDNLIVLFPNQFFVDAANRIILFSIITATVILLIGIFGKVFLNQRLKYRKRHYRNISKEEKSMAAKKAAKSKKVIVYSTKTCPWCHKTKEYLKSKKIKFTDVRVDEDQKKAQEMVEKSGQMGVPVIDIEGTIIIGFDKDAIEEALA